MRVAIVQSSYVPWKGYFDLIHSVDEFVLFDDVQFTRRDWRNRNRIKSADGPMWLTIPVHSKGRYLDAIKDITISDPSWGERHWKTIAANYTRTPYFRRYAEPFERLYRENRDTRLSAVNYTFIRTICGMLGIETKISWSMDYQMREGRTDRLIGICEQAGATTYVSGPSARAYIDESLFRTAGVDLRYFDYAGYPEYRQLFPPFDHHVSMLDLLFNEGPDAPRYMLSF